MCFVVKVIHLKLVTNLTSEGFAATLRGFVNCHGKCRHMCSYNSTNFLRANRELKYFVQIIRNRIADYYASENITWHFSPLRSHHGGLWERVVNAVKHHLTRVACNNMLMNFILFPAK